MVAMAIAREERVGVPESEKEGRKEREGLQERKRSV